jgi:hypothetical protein
MNSKIVTLPSAAAATKETWALQLACHRIKPTQHPPGGGGTRDRKTAQVLLKRDLPLSPQRPAARPSNLGCTVTSLRPKSRHNSLSAKSLLEHPFDTFDRPTNLLRFSRHLHRLFQPSLFSFFSLVLFFSESFFLAATYSAVGL